MALITSDLRVRSNKANIIITRVIKSRCEITLSVSVFSISLGALHSHLFCTNTFSCMLHVYVPIFHLFFVTLYANAVRHGNNFYSNMIYKYYLVDTCFYRVIKKNITQNIQNYRYDKTFSTNTLLYNLILLWK